MGFLQEDMGGPTGGKRSDRGRIKISCLGIVMGFYYLRWFDI